MPQPLCPYPIYDIAQCTEDIHYEESKIGMVHLVYVDLNRKIGYKREVMLPDGALARDVDILACCLVSSIKYYANQGGYYLGKGVIHRKL